MRFCVWIRRPISEISKTVMGNASPSNGCATRANVARVSLVTVKSQCQQCQQILKLTRLSCKLYIFPFNKDHDWELTKIESICFSSPLDYYNKKYKFLTLTHAALLESYFTLPHSIFWLLSKFEGKDQFLNLKSEAAEVSSRVWGLLWTYCTVCSAHTAFHHDLDLLKHSMQFLRM